MAQVINTNIASLNAQRNLNSSQSALQTSLQRLSTGLRINSAKDDAAGLAIAERFTAQIRGLGQATRNANDGISFAQTAEGALGTIGNALQRVRELAVQSANDTNSASDRQALNNEVSQLIAEVNRVASSTQFNGQNVLDGTLSELVFQVGANQGQTISVDGVDARASILGARVSEGGTVSGAGLTAAVTANDIVIQGTSIDITGAENTGDVVSAINDQFASTGVQASLATSVDTGDIAASLSVGTGTDGALTVNGVQVAVANDGADAVDVDQTAANINALSTQTGVSAVVDGGAINLVNSDGSKIALGGANYASGTAENFYAGVVLASDVREDDSDFSVTGTLGVVSGSALGGDQDNESVNAVSVLTREDATAALRSLDFGLQQVNSLRAELGAVQTRFESTISNLGITSESLSAARSRIQDADFAAETAALTKAQILQQAGTSVLAQANAIPQNVLSLLQ